MEKELISVREFAKRVDVDESTIREYIKNNRFKKGVVNDDKGRRKIDYAVALKEWKSIGGGLDKDKRGPKTAPQTTPANPEGRDGEPMVGPDGEEIPDVNVSKARNEYYKAEMAKDEYLKSRGDLVAKKDVYDALFAWGVEIRTAILSVPQLVVDDVMAAKERSAAIEKMYGALEKVLERLTDPNALEKKDDED